MLSILGALLSFTFLSTDLISSSDISSHSISSFTLPLSILAGLIGGSLLSISSKCSFHLSWISFSLVKMLPFLYLITLPHSWISHCSWWNRPLVSSSSCLLCFSNQSVDVFPLIPSALPFHFSIKPPIFLSEPASYSGGFWTIHVSLRCFPLFYGLPGVIRHPLLLSLSHRCLGLWRRTWTHPIWHSFLHPSPFLPMQRIYSSALSWISLCTLDLSVSLHHISADRLGSSYQSFSSSTEPYLQPSDGHYQYLLPSLPPYMIFVIYTSQFTNMWSIWLLML